MRFEAWSEHKGGHVCVLPLEAALEAWTC